MKFKHIMIVYKKELHDLVRDKKTVFSTFILPLILFPLIMFLMSGGLSGFMGDIDEDPFNTSVNLYVEPSKGAQEAARDIFSGSKVNFIDAGPEEAEKLFADGKIDAVLKLEEDFGQKLEQQIPAGITIVFDEMSTNSQAKASAIAQMISAYNQKIGYERLAALGVSPEILTPAVSDMVSYSKYYGVTGRQGSDNMFLQMMLPYLAAILLAASGLGVAIDMIAGEKERATLEPLLSTGADRNSILLGKFLIVLTVTLLGVIAQAAGMAAGFSILGSNSGMGFMSGGISLSAGVIILALLCLVLMGMTFSCITISISAVSRTYKEAQTYSSYVIMLPMIIGVSSMFMQASDVSAVTMVIPVLNVVASLKLVLGGAVNYAYLALAAGSSLLYMLIALGLVRRLFAKEKYMFRG